MARRPTVVVALTLLTLGLYGLYWFHATSTTVIRASGRSSRPVLWLLGLFIPVIDLVILWRYSNTVADVTGRHSGALIFVCFLVFFPAAQYLVQTDLNTAAADASNPIPP